MFREIGFLQDLVYYREDMFNFIYESNIGVALNVFCNERQNKKNPACFALLMAIESE